MNELKTSNTNIDWDCIIRDIASQWWLILMAGLGAWLMTVAIMQLCYHPMYTSENTFVIGRSGFNYHSVSENLQQAETTSKQYTQVVGSSILQKQVCEELNMAVFNAEVTVETVKSSNLMVLRVTADSPRQAYLISRSVISHAVSLMSFFMNDVTMQELQQSQIPTEPSNTVNFYLWGERAGLITVAAMILILGMLSLYKDTVRNSEDALSKIDARLLGTIYYEKKKQSLLLTSPVLSFDYVEASHMLSTRISMTLDRLDKKVLMITSVAENEGKSTIAANLAVSLTQNGKKVLLADCDFRNPSQYKIFSLGNTDHRDFTEAIEKGDKIETGQIQKIPGLLTLFSQKNRTQPWNKEALQMLAQSLEQFRSQVDYIILDTSPAALISDTEEYAAMADTALIVIRQNTTEACHINDTIDALNGAGTQVIGCVLNGVHHPVLTHTAYGKYEGRYRKNNYHYAYTYTHPTEIHPPKGGLPNE